MTISGFQFPGRGWTGGCWLAPHQATMSVVRAGLAKAQTGLMCIADPSVMHKNNLQLQLRARLHTDPSWSFAPQTKHQTITWKPRQSTQQTTTTQHSAAWLLWDNCGIWDGWAHICAPTISHLLAMSSELGHPPLQSAGRPLPSVRPCCSMPHRPPKGRATTCR